MSKSRDYAGRAENFVSLCVALLVAVFLLLGTALATPSITLSKRVGPPTSKILVSGSGFAPNVGVDIFFDTKDEALVVTDGKGNFHDAKIHAPRSAFPGEHWVTALERNNDKGNQEPFVVNTNWSQFHFDADGTRLNPYENVLNPRTVGRLGLNWSYPTGSTSSSPAVANGILYIGSLFKGDLYALNAITGAKLWSYTTGGYVVSSPAVVNGIVYFGSYDHNVYALNARTGAFVWKYTAPDIVLSSPAVANGVVYVGSRDFYALDARTGALLWSYPGTTGVVYTSGAVANGVVYVVDDVILYALDAGTGAELWSSPLGAFPPTVANGLVYVSDGDVVYALDSLIGYAIWNYTTGYIVGGSVAVADGAVYVNSCDKNVYALDATTGAKLWSYLTNNCLYSSPAVANGVVYAGSEDNNLYALDAKTGTKLWSYATGNSVDSSPTIANGLVYVGSDDGNVYSFRQPRGPAEEGADSIRPELSTLRPDLKLKVSESLQAPSDAKF